MAVISPEDDPLFGRFLVLADHVYPPSAPHEEDWPPNSDHELLFWFRTKNWPRHDPLGHRDRLELLELFALLAQADWKMWKAVVREIWPQTARAWEEIMDLRPVRVGIEVYFSAFRDTDSIFESLLTYGRLRPSSVKFVEGKKDVLARMKTRDESRLAAAIPGRFIREPLPQEDEEEEDEGLQSFLLKTLQLVATQQALDHTRVGEAGLKVEELRMNAHWTQLDTLSLRTLSATGTHGVTMVDLPCIDSDLYIQSPKLYVRSLQTFYGVGENGDATRASSSGAIHAVINSTLAKETIVAVYSALRVSQSVKRVSILASHSTNRSEKTICSLQWQWLACALFHRRSPVRQRLQELAINVTDLRVADVAAIERLLKMENPVMALLDRSHLAGAGGDCDTFTASRFLLMDPESRTSDQKNYECERPLSGLCVINQSDNWYCVLLPGWGPAWVGKNDLHATQKTSAPVHEIQSVVPDLVLSGLTHTSKGPALALLGHIGKHLRRLQVRDVPGPKSFDPWCRQALKMCPQLEVLELYHCELSSVQVILDGYAAGWCRLRRLTLVTKVNASIAKLFHALSDEHHAASHHLCELVYHLSTRGANVALICNQAQKMLMQNTRLVVLDLKITADGLDHRTMHPYVDQLCRLDGLQMDRIFSSPREKAQKLAFLSVVFAAANSASPRDVGLLDASVLMVIFALAATRRTRRVKSVLNGFTVDERDGWVSELALL